MQTTKDEYLRQLHAVLDLKKSCKLVEIDAIPALFKDDFIHFFMGETLQKINGKIVISQYKYETWVHKIWTKGLDYAINLENWKEEKEINPD